MAPLSDTAPPANAAIPFAAAVGAAVSEEVEEEAKLFVAKAVALLWLFELPLVNPPSSMYPGSRVGNESHEFSFFVYKLNMHLSVCLSMSLL